MTLLKFFCILITEVININNFSKVKEGFELKETYNTLKQFAEAYNYTYGSVRTNWNKLADKFLNNYDKQILKVKEGKYTKVYVFQKDK